jgi:lipopolysaccharide export system permease protein
MLTLDRYIARQYLVNVAALLVLLNAFVVITSVSLNFDEFLEAARKGTAGGEGGGVSGGTGLRTLLSAVLLVVDIWAPRLVQLFTFLNGFVLVGAMGFTFAQLVRHRELVAMLAGGVSLMRAARPVAVVAGLMLGAQVLVQELVVPPLAPLLARSDRDAGKRDFSSFGVNLLPDGQGRVLLAKSFDPAQRSIENLYVLERDGQGRGVRRITAQRAVWDEGGKLWRLTGGEARWLRVPGEGITVAQRGLVEPVATLGATVDPATLLSQQYRAFSQTMPSGKLIEAAGLPGLQPDVREQLLRVLWGRLSGLCSIVLALAITLPFFLTREPKNMVAQSLKAAPVALGCLLGGVLGAAAPIPSELLPVGLGAFLPVLVMLPLAVAQLTSVRT